MEKGKYYIGDLCYVIKGDNWDEVCSLTYPYTGKNVHKQVEGEFFLEDGRQFCIFSTMYGDGVYYSNEGDEKVVDCTTMDEFMNVLSFVRATAPEDTIAYANPL